MATASGSSSASSAPTAAGSRSERDQAIRCACAGTVPATTLPRTAATPAAWPSRRARTCSPSLTTAATGPTATAPACASPTPNRPCDRRADAAQSDTHDRHRRRLGHHRQRHLRPRLGRPQRRTAGVDHREPRPAADSSSRAQQRGLWIHMGRVNSLRRLAYAASIGRQLSTAPNGGFRYRGVPLPRYLPPRRAERLRRRNPAPPRAATNRGAARSASEVGSPRTSHRRRSANARGRGDSANICS